jgi:hypothetical protein
MSIQFHAGYWTIFIEGKPVMSFESKGDAEALIAGTPREPRQMIDVSTAERLLYILLWTVTDNDGLYRGNPSVLASTLFPDDAESQERIPARLQALAAAGLIRQNFNDHSAFVAIRA